MKYLNKLLLAVASAAFLIVGPALAQNGGTVTNHAFAIGKGAGVTGYSSALCTSAQLIVGQSAADPICKTITGDVTINASGVTAIGSAKVLNTMIASMTSAQLAAILSDETGTGLAYFQGGALGTPLSGTLTNATGLPVSTGVSGLGTGCATFLGTPSSANLRGCLTDEVGTGAAYFVGGALGTPASGTATNLTGLPLTTGVTGTLPLGNGGTGQTTAATARASSGLNVDSFTGHGDSIYTILATDRTVGTNAVFTASRTWTLPAANGVNAGQEIIVADFQGTVTGTNTLVISRAGADTINGVTSVTIASANGAYLFKSDGSSKWTAQALGSAAAGGVTSVTCGTGMTGGTITTSGTCAVSLSSITNSLGADVNLSNTGTYFDGPSTAQGTSGTWLASGQVTFSDSAAGGSFLNCKLWDGTTVIASGKTSTSAATYFMVISLSGVIASPAANIKISCNDPSATTGKMLFNASGNSKDSTLTAIRIN